MGIFIKYIYDNTWPALQSEGFYIYIKYIIELIFNIFNN